MYSAEPVKGIIFDIEGTLLEGGKACAGAPELLEYARGKGIKTAFLSNMTGRTPAMIAASMQKAGLDVVPGEVHTAVTVCAGFLAGRMRGARGFFAVPAATREMLRGFAQHEDSPDYVVLGDLDGGFTYELLDRVFNMIVGGAALIAFHRNALYFKDGGRRLDSGMFTAGLESVTGKQAIITGKPSALAFEAVLAALGEDRRNVLAVGDDINTDVAGAKNAGLRGVLVGTGKFEPRHLEAPYPRPDLFARTLADLTERLRRGVDA